MKKILLTIIALLSITSTVNAAWYDFFFRGNQPQTPIILGAPFQSFQRSLVPIDSTENIGTSTSPWDYGFFNFLQITGLAGSGTKCLQTDNNGLISVASSGCGSGGGGGGAGTFATSTAWGSTLYNYPLNDSDIVLIGYDGGGVATSSSEAEFSFDPVAKLALFLNSTKVGIGTTSPNYILSVDSASSLFPAYFKSTGASTRVLIDNAANTGFGLAIGNILKWSNAVYDQSGTGSNYDYTIWNEQTNSPGVFLDGDTNNVGLGTTSPYAKLSVVGQTVASYFTATTTTASTLPYASTTAVTATNGYITKLGNLTSNGFVKTSGGDGTLSIDTSSYLTGNQTITLSGDVSGSGATSITTTIGAGAVDPAMLADSDFGNFTCATGVCTIDNGSISNSMLTNSTISGIALGSNLADLTAGNGLTSAGTYNGSTARTFSLNSSSLVTNVPITWNGTQLVATGTPNLTVGYLTSTSTTASTLPYASSTALTVSGALYNSSLSDGCLNVTSGLIGSTGSACGSGGGGTFAWTPTTNYGALTNATGTPIWFQAGLQASSTSQIQYASTTAISATNGYITRLGNLSTNGVVVTGSSDGTLSTVTVVDTYISSPFNKSITLNGGSYIIDSANQYGTAGQVLMSKGTAAGDIWVSTTTFSSGLTYSNGNVTSDLGTSIDLASEVTGTLPIGNGGTGQTSFGQGWLHSNGTTLTSSTSPTVNYLVATSTTATSTFAGGLSVGGYLKTNLTAASCDVKALASDGTLYCGTDATGAGGGTFAWTPGDYAGQSINATSTGIRFLGAPLSLIASTTLIDYASTTALTVSGAQYNPTLTSALILTGSDGLFAEYAGTSCTNQVTTALSALGVATCSNINNDYWSGTDLSVANGGTGASTLTGLLQGNGTSAVTAITDSSTAGQVLRVTGASTYGWGALDLDDADAFTGTLPIANLEASTISGISLGSNLADLTATDSTLTFSGTYNGSTARSIGINLSNSNLWTGLQSFKNASSTLFSNTGTAYFGGTATTTIASNGALNVKNGITVDSGVNTGFTYSSGTTNIGSENFSIFDTDANNLFNFTGNTASETFQATFGPSDIRLRVEDSTDTFSFTGGYVGIGTTTPKTALTIASTTGPQLALSNGAGILRWIFRNAGGNLYLATTTVVGNATTTISALEIAGSGFGTTTLRGLNIVGQATSTSNVGINLSGGCFAINGTCISGGAGGSGETNTASSLGTGRNIFDTKSGVDLRFNTIAAGTNITLSTTTNSNTIVISSTGGSGGAVGGFAIVSTSTLITLDMSQYATSTTLKIDVGSSNITINPINATSSLGAWWDLDIVSPLTGVIGTTTISYCNWDGQINPGSNTVNGLTDTFRIKATASTTAAGVNLPYLQCKLTGTY